MDENWTTDYDERGHSAFVKSPDDRRSRRATQVGSENNSRSMLVAQHYRHQGMSALANSCRRT